MPILSGVFTRTHTVQTVVTFQTSSRNGSSTKRPPPWLRQHNTSGLYSESLTGIDKEESGATGSVLRRKPVKHAYVLVACVEVHKQLRSQLSFSGTGDIC